jgi:hypothetical protein
MNGAVFLVGLCLSVQPGPVPALDLPPRPAEAPTGTAFARSIADLPLEEREARILQLVRAGNVPSFLRTLVPVNVEGGTDRVTFFVTPDYLAVGSDEDFFYSPLTPYTAQEIADRLDCILPTTKMVAEIHRSAAVKLTPSPIPPSPAMTTVPVFLQHQEMVLAEPRNQRRGALVAGHKKDVVVTNRLASAPGKVAIYGWHRHDGSPIQPLYTRHSASWVDYSHGIRLVHRRVLVNGESRSMDEVLADPRLAPLLSDEGAMHVTRYELTAAPRPLPSLAAPGEVVDELRLVGTVRAVVNRPEGTAAKPVLLVFYALPNGNTIEQTVGKAVGPEDDWHFGIQHIGAQTRFLREALTDLTLVVAYLECDGRNWPSWRKKHADIEIPLLFDAIRKRYGGPRPRLVLSGYSGGGSLLFGYINAVATIPDDVARIAWLDANYAYNTARHQDKLVAWLKASDRHHLVVLAYDDASARLNGKPFVSAEGGTWGRSRLMLRDLEGSMPFTAEVSGGLHSHRALQGRVTFLLKENPAGQVLHTVQVERNGFIASLLAGTPHEEHGYTYLGERAYERFIRPN